jgi:hypothetical protein
MLFRVVVNGSRVAIERVDFPFDSSNMDNERKGLVPAFQGPMPNAGCR